MSRFIAILDASVLFSIRATNLALHAANEGLYQPRWSPDIHEEWTRSLLAKNPAADPQRIVYRRTTMDGAFPSALVSGYESLVPSITLPDPDDRHVVAAAIAARADVIVTFNTRDFPAEALAPFGLEAQHPDVFLLHQLTLNWPRFLVAARKARQQMKAPPHTVAAFLDGLRRANLPLLADTLASNADAL